MMHAMRASMARGTARGADVAPRVHAPRAPLGGRAYQEPGQRWRLGRRFTNFRSCHPYRTDHLPNVHLYTASATRGSLRRVITGA